MKALSLILISLLLLSCDKNDEDTQDFVIGKWQLVAKEEMVTDKTKLYPDSLTKIEIVFQQDSIIMYGCNMFLGSGSYKLSKQNILSVNNFNYTEPCSLGDWIETVASSLTHSTSVDINSDTLKIISNEIYCDYSLKLVSD